MHYVASALRRFAECVAQFPLRPVTSKNFYRSEGNNGYLKQCVPLLILQD